MTIKIRHMIVALRTLADELEAGATPRNDNAGEIAALTGVANLLERGFDHEDDVVTFE